MYVVPLTNSPNQVFTAVIPINGENKQYQFTLSYNSQAKYWQMGVTDLITKARLFDNLPLLTSKGQFFNILNQLQYLQIGICGILPLGDDNQSMPSDENIGKAYIMVWSDN